jgi:hypothetical protein
MVASREAAATAFAPTHHGAEKNPVILAAISCASKNTPQRRQNLIEISQ